MMETKPDDGEIVRKFCPICRSTIWRCQRFRPIIEKIVDDIYEVTNGKIFGDTLYCNIMEKSVFGLRDNPTRYFYTGDGEYDDSDSEDSMGDRHLMFRHNLLRRVFAECDNFATRVSKYVSFLIILE